MHINTAAVNVHRSKPSAVMNDDDARHHTVSNVAPASSAPRLLRTSTTSPDSMPRVLSIRRIDPARFAVFNIGKMMTGRTVKLAVHAVAALTKTSRKAPS